MDGLSTSFIIHTKNGSPYTPSQKEYLGIKSKEFSPWTEIGHDVWIGDGVVILPGIKIGTGAVIGANSVVTQDIPEYSVAVGAPAREIRKRFPEKIIADLLKTEYWEIPIEDIQRLPTRNIFELLESHPKNITAENYKTFSFEQD